MDDDGIRVHRRSVFFEHVAMQFDRALAKAERDLAAGSDPRGVVRDVLYGCLHDVFAVIDGDTGLPDFDVGLFDDDGNEFGPGLHEWFVDHMFDTGRME